MEEWDCYDVSRVREDEYNEVWHDKNLTLPVFHVKDRFACVDCLKLRPATSFSQKRLVEKFAKMSPGMERVYSEKLESDDGWRIGPTSEGRCLHCHGEPGAPGFLHKSSSNRWRTYVFGGMTRQCADCQWPQNGVQSQSYPWDIEIGRVVPTNYVQRTQAGELCHIGASQDFHSRFPPAGKVFLCKTCHRKVPLPIWMSKCSWFILMEMHCLACWQRLEYTSINRPKMLPTNIAWPPIMTFYHWKTFNEWRDIVELILTPPGQPRKHLRRDYDLCLQC